MPRQSSRRSAPARPAAPPQSRSASTTTQQHVPAQAPPPQPPAVQQVQPKQPGLFAQMASTAAGVAVGSAVGHTIGAGLTGMFSGGSKEAAPAQQAAPQQSQYQGQNVCEPDQRAFQACLEKNPSDISACQFYLDMLKQCQANSRQWA
ncbi:Coiled-coil-helix-coiled-coil-helix domain-containing protein 2 [Phlyctochytrium bullatum]|nr:Coiled-coil-helix-coiled-coil-helix domain-containing protein 2 [Phlyctochytrium bullatum]